MTYEVNIINPIAKEILDNLAELNLISLKESSGDEFLKVVRKIRRKASANPPSLEEITREVDAVRSKRYARKKR